MTDLLVLLAGTLAPVLVPQFRQSPAHTESPTPRRSVGGTDSQARQDGLVGALRTQQAPARPPKDSQVTAEARIEPGSILLSVAPAQGSAGANRPALARALLRLG